MSPRKASLLLPALLAAAPMSAQPLIEPIERTVLLSGSPLHLPVVAGAPEADVRFTAESSDPVLLEAVVLTGNRSLRMSVTGFGEMVFELFEQRAPRPALRIATLADSGFYDGVVFHRVIDDFVIQGGDPTGTGSGGSDLGTFDDQYHVDLQHNRRGLLSMAKSSDDTNDSQFFVTETAARNLDFQHSIFGLLTRGEAVREAISETPTDASDRPLSAVAIDSARTFVDGGAATLMLRSPEGAAGTASVTVTATDAAGAVAVATFEVEIQPDTIDSAPFLADVPAQSTRVDTPFTFALEALDVEGDPARFLDQETLAANGLTVTVFAHEDLGYAVDFETGLVTVTPRNGLTGPWAITVATAVSVQAVDYQVVPITIEP